jgi:hypothetical protein
MPEEYTEPEDEYSEQEEYQDNVVDEQREMWEDTTGMNYPVAKKPDSLFSLFRDVWKTPDSIKVGNLDKEELGDLGISVRDCHEIAAMAALLHHPRFAKYFAPLPAKSLAEITSATSMSKKGWFVEMFITSKKFAAKGNLGNLKQFKKPKWRLFGQKTEQQQEQE